MRLAIIGFLAVSLCHAADLPADLAQQPTVPVTPEKAAQRQDDSGPDTRDNRQKQLTPEEEMERQIRLFDPKYRPDQDQSGSSAGRDIRINRPQSDSSPDSTLPSGPVVADPADRPLPGSLAASRETASVGTGPRVAEDAGGEAAYNGPAVLSHSYTLNSLTLPKDEKWIESFSLGEVYDTGAAKLPPDAAGMAQSSAMNGYQVSWTLGSQRVLHHDQFGFIYSGSLSRYQSVSPFSGLNHTATATWTHMFSRRLTLSTVTTGSILSSSATLQNPTADAGPSLANLNLSLSPNLQPTDTGTKQVNTQASLAWQQSARLSFNFSGGYFGMIRSGAGLVGATGRQAQGGVNYRYTRRITLGFYYSNNHTQFPHGLGASDTNVEGLSYALTLGKSTQISLRTGLSKTESIAETPVPVLPIVAALLGVQSGIVDYYHATSSADISAQLVRDLGRRRTMFAAYVKGVSPGNGVLLTSSQESYSLGMTSRLFRQYTLQVNASKTALTSISQTFTNRFESSGVQITLNRTYRSGLGFETSVGYRYFGHSNPQYEPNEIHLSSGITWGPPHPRLWPF